MHYIHTPLVKIVIHASLFYKIIHIGYNTSWISEYYTFLMTEAVASVDVGKCIRWCIYLQQVQSNLARAMEGDIGLYRACCKQSLLAHTMHSVSVHVKPTCSTVSSYTS